MIKFIDYYPLNESISINTNLLDTNVINLA